MPSEAEDVVKAWVELLPKRRIRHGLPFAGTIAAALIIAEKLREDFTLDLNAHRADGLAQIKQQNRPKVQAILARHGEGRILSSEGGRTNRGAPGDMQLLLNQLQTSGASSKSAEDRNRLLDEIQAQLVKLATDLLNCDRLSVSFEPEVSTQSFLTALLAEAHAAGKWAALAQHLVGAKLELRFPNTVIPSNRVMAADASTGREGDFELGDMVFHVTVAPGAAVMEKCKRNLGHGRRVYVLVPEETLVGARQNAELVAPRRIAVQSIESFVATNIEELSDFTGSGVKSGLRRLLETYNRRVSEAETDLSLLIEMPSNLS